ncbi:hypothetical protein TNCV_993421 [Trichonephila clavipes]|nr:hypothetical protein TNCV_993421 [Trichonephila clavipes]
MSYSLITELLIEECWKIETSWNSKLQIDIEENLKVEKPTYRDTRPQDSRNNWRLDFKDMNLSLQVCDASKSSYARQDIRLPIMLFPPISSSQSTHYL